MQRMQGKVAVITGGAGAIGSALAQMIVQEGGKVLLVDLNETALQQTIQQLGKPDVQYAVADVTKEEQVQQYVQQAVREFGTIDIFYNNAGIEGTVAPLDEYPIEKYHQVIAVNVHGVYYGLRHVFPVMKQNSNGGSIIITSSVAGLSGTPNVLPYVTSKHAVIGMMRTAAKEGAPFNIRVNTVNPAPVNNRMMRSLEEGFAPGAAEQAQAGFAQAIPLGRYATNEEVAQLMFFLGSDESRFITGAIHPVDGGMTA